MTLQPPRDDATPVSDLKAAIAAFNAARRWQPFFSPKNLAMSIAIEAAELMEIFQWADNAAATAQAAQPGAVRDRMAEELADVLIYGLTLATALDLDVSTIVMCKLEANALNAGVPDTCPSALDGSPRDVVVMSYIL